MADQQHSVLTQRFGAWVRERRTEAGLTQAQLAEQMRSAGVTIDPTGVTRIERGGRALKIDEAQVLTQILGSSLSRVLSEVEPAVSLESGVAEVTRLRRQAVIRIAELQNARWQLLDIAQKTQLPSDDDSLRALTEALGLSSDMEAVLDDAYLAAMGVDMSNPFVSESVNYDPNGRTARAFRQREAERRRFVTDKLSPLVGRWNSEAYDTPDAPPGIEDELRGTVWRVDDGE